MFLSFQIYTQKLDCMLFKPLKLFLNEINYWMGYSLVTHVALKYDYNRTIWTVFLKLKYRKKGSAWTVLWLWKASNDQMRWWWNFPVCRIFEYEKKLLYEKYFTCDNYYTHHFILLLRSNHVPNNTIILLHPKFPTYLL